MSNENGRHLLEHKAVQHNQHPPDQQSLQPCDTRMSALRRIKHSYGGLKGLQSLLLTILAFCLLISVTDAQAVKIQQALMSMMQKTMVGEIHNVSLILYRDQGDQPEVFWQPNQCFKLTFNTPYTQPQVDPYYPFDPANPPKCIVTQLALIDGVECNIGTNNNELQIYFTGFKTDDNGNIGEQLKSISMFFTNFHNPWSAVEMQSITINSYASQDCSGSSTNQYALGGLEFVPKDLPDANVKITSSSTVLGDQSAANAVTFAITPSFTMSKNKKGLISINVPQWYDGTRLNMMFQSTTTCVSPTGDMRILDSVLDLFANVLRIRYDQMLDNKVSGEEITITCDGFKNPIYQKEWPGFRVSYFDDEPAASQIETSGNLFFDATKFTPAVIKQENLNIAPTIFKIAEYSTWFLSLTNFPIPLETGCYIELTIPTDLRFINTEFKGTDMFKPRSSNIIIIESQETTAQGTVVRLEGCFTQSSVGLTPQGRLDIALISTPLARRDTGRFYFTVYKDPSYTSKIAELIDGVYIPAGDLAPGLIKVNSITPDQDGVQLVTTLTINFWTEHTLYAGSNVKIEFPQSIILPATNSQVVLSGTYQQLENDGGPNGGVDKPKDGQQPVAIIATAGTVESGNIIKISNIFGNANPAFTGKLQFVLRIQGIQNPYSSKEAGDVSIQTFLDDDLVDEGTSDGSYKPTSGSIQGRPIEVTDPVTSGRTSTYKLIFTAASAIPKDGFIEIIVPPSVQLRPTEVFSGGVCTQANLACITVKDNIIRVKTQLEIPPNTPTTILLTGITNPRTDEPTDFFRIITYDANGISEIDAGFDKSTKMEKLATIDSITVTPSSVINGDTNQYTITVSTRYTILDGDVLKIIFPKEVGVPLTPELLNPTSVKRIIDGNEVSDELQGEVSGQIVTIKFIKVGPASETYKFTIDNVKNPPSEQPSEPFQKIISTDKDDYGVQEQPVPDQIITNSQPNILQDPKLVQIDDDPLVITTYQISFKPFNPIPSQGSMQIASPSQIVVDKDSVTCSILTNRWYRNTPTETYCVIDDAGTITITGVFADQATFEGDIQIDLVGVRNPRDNKTQGQGFVIHTYADGTQTFRIDTLASNILVPTLECAHPCATCLENDRAHCTSCWTESWAERKYFYTDQQSIGRCGLSCPEGETRDNEPSFKCIPCDVSCKACKDENKAFCTICADKFPYKLSGTAHCLESCSRGYFETATASTCATCEAPCYDCEGDSQFCTACDPDSEFPVLFNNQCIRACAQGYTAVNGVCTACASPCATCLGTPNFCLSCDGTLERRFLYSNQCYSDCPLNSTPDVQDEDNLVCIGCADPACELCDAEDPKLCKRCAPTLYVHEGVCISGCPEGWKTNDDGTACVLFTINDIGILPFPFLIAAFFGCLIALFGKCKKKPGRTKYISTQNTITCFIVIIAFIQFLAIIALIIWALLFGTIFLFIAACALLAFLIILNIVFQIFYMCTFNRRITPKDKLRKYKEGKITKAELKKYVHPSDEDFHRYVMKHKCVSCCIACSTFACTFKCNKTYYSRFYSFDMFKARWSQGKYYRKAMTIFCIVAMVIDALCICVCIASLITMEAFSNMLWITTVEVAVLSLLLIIFGCIELYMLKQYLSYNEQPKATWGSSNTRQKFDVSSANDFLDKDSREVMMKNLLRNVKTNQDMFLNNKLDDLLNMFGDRRCKSMIELGTGWDKEDDPRRVITWPLSPSKIAEYDGEYHFTKADMIGGFEDNVYAEAKKKDPVYEVAVQGDQGQQDFMRQLHRKQGDLLAGQIDEGDELMTRKQKGKRRGRKNKYYAAIDAEDDEEADGQEPSAGEEDEEQEDNLAIIKEQEEEEEQLRLKVEEERKKQERAQADRRAKLAEAERLRLEAEAAEEEARRQAAEEEQRMLQMQEQEELDRMRELETTRARLAAEEEEARKKAEADEAQRKKELAAMNEANRAKYEKEEAARKKSLEEEQARLKREKDEHDKKVQAELNELNKRKQLEAQQHQAQRDEEELRLRKQMLEREEQKRQEEKEMERLRLEQEAAERKMLAAKTAEEKRTARMEEERVKREADEFDRQRRLEQAEIQRQEAIRLEEEKRQKRIQEDDARRLRIEQEERIHKERLQREEEERRSKLEADEQERLARMRREEDRQKARMENEEASRKALLEQQEAERMQKLQREETKRLEKLKKEEEQRLEALRVEESTRLKTLQQEEEARLRRIEEEEEARKRQEEEDRKRRQADEDRKAREEEDRILREKQAIEDEKARLASAKAKQDAAAKELARKEEERRQKELRDTEERIERERLEREAMDKERAELEKKKKAAEEKLLSEKDEMERARLLKEAEDLERQEELRRQREALDEERRRKAAEDAAQANQEVISEKKLEEEDEALEAEIVMSAEPLQDFGKPNHPVEMPPNADSRTFNVHDILGELDRDDRGNIQVLQNAQGKDVDKTGHPTNVRGYLQNPNTGDILENHTKQKLFDADDIDEKGEIPAPFCVEKFNFNPHDLMGDLEFQYDQSTGRAIPQLLQTKQGFYVDKKGRRVNRFGWLEQGGNRHVVDKHGRKKFDRKQLDDGDIQKLLNYSGKRFDVKDVIGVFDKDANGNIIPQRGSAGVLTDNVGRRVNEKGYLIDQNGNIIDREGKKIFENYHLKNGEFPKFFLFTKFNIDNITGDFEMSPLSEPILEQDANGRLIDRQGRLVNPRGYLVDPAGNIIDKRGKRMFDKVILDSDGEIPKIFRTQMLKTDSGSSLSRLMDEIEKNQPSEYDRVPEEGKTGGDGQDGDTSVDSAMEDTPANYNIPNQRFDEYEDYEAIPEESDRKGSKRGQRNKRPTTQPDVEAGLDDLPQKKKKKMKKKKKKDGYLEYLMPTNREINMADAYGGQAKGQFRRPGVKYDKVRLQNRIKTPANIPGGRAQLEALAATVAGFHKPNQSRIEDDKMSARGGARPPKVKRNQFMDGSNDGGSQIGGGSQMSRGLNPKKQGTQNSRSNLNDMRDRKMRTQQRRGDVPDGDFEKMFGKDIDQYLEGSEFDLEEYDKLSQVSRGTGQNSQANVKLKAMEQVYLQRIESSQVQEASAQSKKSTQVRQGVASSTNASMQPKKQKSSPKKPPAFREFQDRFTDQPDFIHRGEVLEFETKKPSEANSKKRTFQH